ncbi:MAG: energy transducer TonB [Burkholderiaceae bacterium]
MTVSFAINNQGKVLTKKIEESSGADILDQAALRMIERASPLPAPPPGYGSGPHSFRIPVSFSLR